MFIVKKPGDLKPYTSSSINNQMSIFENLEEIPKIIHISWKSKEVLNSQNPMILNGIGNMKNINPEYDLQISNDSDVEDYIKSKIEESDYNNIKNKHIVEKVDLWRLLKMYHEGGVYLDIDRYCNIPFRNIIIPGKKWVLPTCNDSNFSQDLMITCKNNPVYYNAILMNLSRRRRNPSAGIYYLGPITYTNAITFTLYNKIFTKDGEIPANLFEFIRRQLNNTKYIQSFREDNGGCDGFHTTLLYSHKLGGYQNGNGLTKKDFYDKYNVSFWGEV
jgi:hypothetical protein